MTSHSAILEAVHEAATDLHEIALIDKKTMRRFDENCLAGRVCEIRLRPEENSVFGQNVEAVAEAEDITREEAAARVLAAWGLATSRNAEPQE